MSDLVLTDRAALALVDEAERALAEATTPDDADELWRKVKAVEEAARLARVSEVVVLGLRRTQLRAKRRYGELLGPAENRGPATLTARKGSDNAEHVSRNRARKLAAVPAEAFEQAIGAESIEQISEAAILRASKIAEHRDPIPPPTGAYSTVVIDPPWPMQKVERKVRPNQVRPLDYPPMGESELRELVIPAADDAHLYLWTTHKFLPMALRLCEAWGFRYQCLLTWRKNVGFTPFSFMYSTEHAIFARRGSLDLLVKGRRLDFDAKVREHSRKPDAFYELVRDVSPAPRLDMFSREDREGFKAWGNEAGKFADAA